MQSPHASTLLAGVALAAAALATAAPAGAQTIFGPTIRVGPQFVSYDIKDPVNKTISQFAVPVSVAYPITSRLVVDLATAYASSTVDVDGGAKSEINGLTDTQLRANYVFGTDNVIVTAGLNLPTGHETIDFTTELDAAGQIGNDFLAFPISNMGTGMGGTGGVALARAFGDWNLGAGLAFRVSSAFDAIESDAGTTRYQPGNEIRVRAGGDHAVPGGRLALGVTYSKFGDDQAGEFAYPTGDRFIAQGSYQAQLGGSNLVLSGWNLHRLEGTLASNDKAPAENIANLAAALGFAAGGVTIEPNVEVRRWTRDGESAGNLAQLGLRLRRAVGKFEIFPSAAYSIGGLETGTGTADLSGMRGILSIRFTP